MAERNEFDNSIIFAQKNNFLKWWLLGIFCVLIHIDVYCINLLQWDRNFGSWKARHPCSLFMFSIIYCGIAQFDVFSGQILLGYLIWMHVLRKSTKRSEFRPHSITNAQLEWIGCNYSRFMSTRSLSLSLAVLIVISIYLVGIVKCIFRNCLSLALLFFAFWIAYRIHFNAASFESENWAANVCGSSTARLLDCVYLNWIHSHKWI